MMGNQRPKGDELASPSTTTRLHPVAPRGPVVGRVLAHGKLLIEECVGEGGVGTVYRAQHRHLHMPVAVKLMHEQYERDPAFCARFRAEALSASRLDHPNLTRVLDFGQEADGLLYIAMEYLDGFCLRDVLESEGQLPLGRAARILFQVCAALAHAHSRGTVHRDIKPENIVIVASHDDDGEETEIVKLCDFGIAQSTVGAGAPSAATRFAGTAEYMSPELLEGGVADPRSDVYACGVLLYELLTGTVPIQGDQAELAERIRRVLIAPPSKLVPGLDPRVDAVVMKALAKDPSDRHATARELRIELRSAMEMLAGLNREDDEDCWREIDPPSTRLVAAIARSGAERGSVSDHKRERSGAERGSVSEASDKRARRDAAYVPPEPSPLPPPRPPMQTQSDWLEHGSYLDVMSQPSLSAPHSTFMDVARRAAIVSTLPPPGQSPEQHGPISGVRAAVRVGGSQPTLLVPSPDAIATAGVLRKLAETTDPMSFATYLQALEPQVRTMLEQAHADPLWRLCSTLEMIATEATGHRRQGSRAAQATSFLTLFSDVQLLGPLAQKALEALQDGTCARKLLVRAGNFGAHALYSARVKDQHPVFETRERFISALREIGPAGLATVRDALSLLESKLDLLGAISVAEDLLQTVDVLVGLGLGGGTAGDEKLIATVARYAQSSVKNLALLGTQALPYVAGDQRSRPLLVAHLRHAHDEVMLMALAHLRRAGGLEEDILSQLRPILLSPTGSCRPLVRRVVAEAFTDAAASARPMARWVLFEAFKSMVASTPDADDLLMTIAGALLTIGGAEEAIAFVHHTQTLDPLVRGRLDQCLRNNAILRGSRPDGVA